MLHCKIFLAVPPRDETWVLCIFQMMPVAGMRPQCRPLRMRGCKAVWPLLLEPVISAALHHWLCQGVANLALRDRPSLP